MGNGKEKNSGNSRSTFVLRRKRDKNGIVQWYKAGLVLRSNDEMACNMDDFSAAVGDRMRKFMFLHSKYNNKHIRQYCFENTFSIPTSIEKWTVNYQRYI